VACLRSAVWFVGKTDTEPVAEPSVSSTEIAGASLSMLTFAAYSRTTLIDGTMYGFEADILADAGCGDATRPYATPRLRTSGTRFRCRPNVMIAADDCWPYRGRLAVVFHLHEMVRCEDRPAILFN
jgi:hypothetical protein